MRSTCTDAVFSIMMYFVIILLFHRHLECCLFSSYRSHEKIRPGLARG